MDIGKDFEQRRLSKNMRISRSKFNEIFGYETKTSTKKPGGIEKNKFNLKIENTPIAFGFNNHYKINSFKINESVSPLRRHKSTSRGRVSLSSYYQNPLSIKEIKEFIPKSKRVEQPSSSSISPEKAANDKNGISKILIYLETIKYKYDAKEVVSVFYHMKFLKNYEFPKDLLNNYSDVFMTKIQRENLDQLTKKNVVANNNNRQRANTYMESGDCGISY